MMTKKKIAMCIATVAACVMACGATMGCSGGEPAAELNGEYISTARVETSMVFTSNYVETLQMYSDGTYCLEYVGATFYRGAEGGSDSAWGNYKIAYYGNCTSTSEEGVMTVEISVPERITIVSGITISSSIVMQWDSATDESATIGGETTVSTEKLMNEFNIKAQTISVNESTYQFTYIDLGLELLPLSQHFGALQA